MKKLSVKSLDDLDAVLLVARNQFEANGNQEVIIKNLKESLRDAQRGLYWWWLGVIAGDIGNTKEEQHLIYKELFLLNIFLHDPENHPDFAELVENMLVVKKQAPEQYKAIRAFVIDNISHLDASKENMMDYLKEIENHAGSLQIRLPAPERKDLM